MRGDPVAGEGTDPSGHSKNSLVIGCQVAGKDRLMVSNTVAERPQIIQLLMSLLSSEARLRKSFGEGRAP